MFEICNRCDIVYDAKLNYCPLCEAQDNIRGLEDKCSEFESDILELEKKIDVLEDEICKLKEK